MIQDTIAAIATPVGAAGIGVIRVSGAGALAVASRVFRGLSVEFPGHGDPPEKRNALPIDASGQAPRGPHHGVLVEPNTGESIDDVVLTVFRAPSSYTGEDVVEISCHGSIAVIRDALNAVLCAGSRLAEPGEFTRRAFLNGKLDLAQAEAVNDLIRSRTSESRRAALRQLDGRLSGEVSRISATILALVAAIEAAIDFPDDVAEPAPNWVRREMASARASLAGLISSFGKGRIFREGLRLVIAGDVNVGKSSLLNALLRHARAIVTPIPGTTRDTIEESLEIHGIPIVAVDTAGLRSTDDPIEKIGVELATRVLECADLVLLVLDAAAVAASRDIEIFSCVRGKQAIVVLNKVDLVPDETRRELIELCARETQMPVVGTCAASGEGIERLENEIAGLVTTAGLGGRKRDRHERPPPAASSRCCRKPGSRAGHARLQPADRPRNSGPRRGARLPGSPDRRDRRRGPSRRNIRPVLHRKVIFWLPADATTMRRNDKARQSLA